MRIATLMTPSLKMTRKKLRRKKWKRKHQAQRSKKSSTLFSKNLQIFYLTDMSNLILKNILNAKKGTIYFDYHKSFCFKTNFNTQKKGLVRHVERHDGDRDQEQARSETGSDVRRRQLLGIVSRLHHSVSASVQNVQSSFVV